MWDTICSIVFLTLWAILISCDSTYAHNSDRIVLENNAYRISVLANHDDGIGLEVERKDQNEVQRKLNTTIAFLWSHSNPNAFEIDAQNYRFPVVGWNQEDSGAQLNSWADLDVHFFKATSVSKVGSTIIEFLYDYPDLPGKIEFRVILNSENDVPIFETYFKPDQKIWYSIAFMGITPLEPGSLDFLYQPLTWGWKRFPSKSYLTPEGYCTTAATFTNSNGVTEGIAPDPSEIPYRYATFENSKFGLSIRNMEGMAQPVLFSPVFGGEGSLVAPGSVNTFQSRYILNGGDWYSGTRYILKDIFQYRNERQNITVTLNETLQNMLDYAMNDRYSGWISDLKASDYVQDVVGTVKNVSALHALGTALITGNREIYKHRAIPMTEYMMSRQKYLYSISDSLYIQSPSHYLKGPCAEIGELAGLYSISQGRSEAFRLEMERVFGKPRELNLETTTGGGSWYDYLYRYQITRNESDLEKAIDGADEYLDKILNTYPTSFEDNPGLKDRHASFYTDFTPRLFDLFQLYEVTNEDRFLDSATLAAQYLLLWLRSNPMAPDTSITVNKGGKVPGKFGKRYKYNSYDFLPDYNDTTHLAEQVIPAWRTSLIGLSPEQPYTYKYGTIMLSHYAAWLLRFAKFNNDDMLRDAAYNAIIGRYANFPGYYFTSFETDVYQRADYPMHDFYDVKYNAIFYNHIWPHIALLIDFIVSDAYYRSNGNIDFPSIYAPGYAYLTSKVYGHRPGTIYGNVDVYPWLPKGAVQHNSLPLNHILGIGPKDLFVVLMNTSENDVKTNIRLNPDVIPWDTGTDYNLVAYSNDHMDNIGQLSDGCFDVNVPANGIVTVKIEDLAISPPLYSKEENMKGMKSKGDGYIRQNHKEPALGTITGMVLNFVPQLANVFLYTDATEKEVKCVNLKYKIGNGEWKVVEDSKYPYEFSLELSKPDETFIFQWEATDLNGRSHKTSIMNLDH